MDQEFGNAARRLVLAVSLWIGLALPASASATTLYEWTFDDFAANWTTYPPSPPPSVLQGEGVATLSPMTGEALGRSDSIDVSTMGIDWGQLTFSLETTRSEGSTTSVYIAYFLATQFLDAEPLFHFPAGGPATYTREGETLTLVPDGADGFRIVLFALGPTTIDQITVTSPEPSLAAAVAVAILAMLHIRGRRQRV